MISPLTASTALVTALAEIAALVAVAQLERLVRAGRGAGRHGGAAHGAGLERDIDLDGRVAAAVQDLPAVDADDLAIPHHLSIPLGYESRRVSRGTVLPVSEV